jgi:molybdate transport system substrate-binding protein
MAGALFSAAAAVATSSVVLSSGGAAGVAAATPRVRGSATVSAAASLTQVFGAIQTKFEKADPAASITINYGSSGVLESQIENGAPVDVAAFADQQTMAKLSGKGLLAGKPKVFATNHLVIVTKPGNPSHIEKLSDLQRAGTISLCAETAPCGVYADQILQGAGVVIPQASVTRGQDVKATLAAVAQGDAAAGIVYVTDARSAGSTVAAVRIPASQNLVAQYPIAVLKASTSQTVARAFERYVRSPAGQSVLEKFGFGPG